MPPYAVAIRIPRRGGRRGRRPLRSRRTFPRVMRSEFQSVAEGDTSILHSSLFIFHYHRHSPTAARLSSASSARFTTVNSSRNLPVWACSAWE